MIANKESEKLKQADLDNYEKDKTINLLNEKANKESEKRK